MNTCIKQISAEGDYFTQRPGDILPDKYSFVFGFYVVRNSDQSTYSPNPGKIGAWYNVLTFGATNRCTQIAIQAYQKVSVPQNTMYMRTQHDDQVSNWVKISTGS